MGQQFDEEVLADSLTVPEGVCACGCGEATRWTRGRWKKFKTGTHTLRLYHRARIGMPLNEAALEAARRPRSEATKARMRKPKPTVVAPSTTSLRN